MELRTATSAAGLQWKRIGGNNPFSSMSRFSLVQIDVEVEEPEMLENPMELVEMIL